MPYVHDAVPLSRVAAQEADALHYDHRIASAGVLAYLREFVDGDRRPWLEANLPHAAAQFTTIGNEGTEDDVLNPEGQLSMGTMQASGVVQDERTLVQLARKALGYHMRLPTVLVTDNGATVPVGGLSTYQGQHLDEKRNLLIKVYSRGYSISLDILIGGKDEDQCADLTSMVGQILSARGSQGSHIRGKNWTLHLPLGYTVSAQSTQTVMESAQRSVAFASISIDVHLDIARYETFDVTAVEGTRLLLACPGGRTGHQRELAGGRSLVQRAREPLTREVQVPATMRLGEKPRVVLNRYPRGTLVYSSDRRVAIIDDARTIHPRGPGTFDIFVKPPTGPVESFPSAVTL